MDCSAGACECDTRDKRRLVTDFRGVSIMILEQQLLTFSPQ